MERRIVLGERVACSDARSVRQQAICEEVYLSLRLAFLVQIAAAANTAAQQPCAVSPGRMLAVAPGVRIEVREWGGHGEPLLFLAGLTATSRAFDDFAPLFTDQFRVIGITRRGIPPSDTAAADYSATVLTRDLVTVMDSLSIRAAHVAGASFGGDEAIVLAANYPSRVLTVTLLESYDNSAEAQTFKALTAVDTLDEPFSAYDSTSPLAFAANSRRNGNRPWPMSEICAQFRFAPNGRYLGSATSAAVAQALHAGMPRLPYHKVHQPVLAFFRSDRGIEDWVPYIGGVDSVYRAQSYGAYRVALQTLADARARFRREMPHARVLEIAGASHGIFRSDPEIVYLAMRRFLSARQGR